MPEKQDYRVIYDSALFSWKKQEYAESLELFQQTKLLADSAGDVFYANRALNEIEIRQKRIYLESKVRAIHLTLTDRCNMKCQFCYLHRYSAKWDMPAKACEDIITYFPYLQQLVWQGGEAFLHPYFKQMIIESSRYHNIQQTLITNGSFLDEEWLGLFLKIKRFHIVMPIESTKEEIYDDLRRGGSLKKLKKGIELANLLRKSSNSEFMFTLNIIVMKKNYLELEELVDFAIANNFFQIILTPLYPNNSEFYEKEYLSAEDENIHRHFSEVMPKIWDKAERNNIYLADRFTGIKKERVTDSVLADYGEFIDKAGCLSPWQQLFIESAGDVKNYCSCNWIVGNLNNNSIKEIWNGEKIRQLRQNILNYDYRTCNSTCAEGTISRDNLRLR